MYSTFAIQLRLHRASRASLSSPSKSADSRRMSDRSTFSNALTLTTPYNLSSILEVTTGTMPQRAHVWNEAFPVPNEYLDTSAEFRITIRRAPRGFEVHTPPCLEQKEHAQARAGIWAGSGSQARENEMFPQ